MHIAPRLQHAAPVPFNALRPAPAAPLANIPLAAGPWIAREGVLVTIRPIRKSDFEREKEFVRGLSADTGYQRLMSPRVPSDDELLRWTDVDHGHEVALVATTVVDGNETQIGVARYVVDTPSHEAEFAIVLGDRWQGRGLGSELLARLAAAAKQSGVAKLVGTTLSENRPMLALARRHGFKARSEAGSAFVTVLTLDLAAWAAEAALR